MEKVITILKALNSGLEVTIGDIKHMDVINGVLGIHSKTKTGEIFVPCDMPLSCFLEACQKTPQSVIDTLNTEMAVSEAIDAVMKRAIKKVKNEEITGR